MARDYIGIRMGEDLRAQIEQLCLSSGMTISEWVRLACVQAVNVGLDGNALVNEGYIQGRQTAIHMMRLLFDANAASFPSTYEEAIAMFPQLLTEQR